MDWTVLKLLTWTTDFFKKRGIPSARLDAELLLADTLHCSRVQLYTRHDQPLAAQELAEFRARVTRRGAREPVAYILGRKEFWSLDFEVGPGVLIPRPDTEILVDEAIRLLGGATRILPGANRRPVERKALPWNAEVLALAEKNRQEAKTAEPSVASEGGLDSEAVATAEPVAVEDPATATPAAAPPGPPPKLVLDLCTGSGIIPICIAKETGARAIGVDISAEALEYARKNATALAPSGAVALLQGDLSAPVPKRFHGRFDLVTSNPPYISSQELVGLEPEITQFEPSLALEGGADGNDLYRRLVPEVLHMLQPGGWTLLEVGTASQGEAVLALLNAAGFVQGSLLKDLAGQVRVVKAQKRP